MNNRLRLIDRIDKNPKRIRAKLFAKPDAVIIAFTANRSGKSESLNAMICNALKTRRQRRLERKYKLYE